MKTKKLSPYQTSGIAFLIVVGLAVCSGVTILLFAPLLPASVAWDSVLRSLNTLACPGAIIVGVVAYFWAKNKA
jgi:hypothetical protein